MTKAETDNEARNLLNALSNNPTPWKPVAYCFWCGGDHKSIECPAGRLDIVSDAAVNAAANRQD